jgi:tetratricopeptide (TPR) repeat protein
MNSALDLLGPLASLETTHPLGWKGRIDQIMCFRLLEDDGATRTRLKALLDQDPPPHIQLRARAEHLLLALSSGRWEEVGVLMDRGRELDGVTSAELDYAWLKSYLEGWRAADRSGDDQQTRRLQEQAEEMIHRIRNLYGPYWIRRAQMLMSVFVQQTNGSSLDMWGEAAENAFRSGQHDEALTAYDRMRALAEEQGSLDRAFDAAYKAAAIEHLRGRHHEALSRFRNLALTMADNPKASEAHWLAVLHAAELARQGAPDALDDYVALLQENQQKWPKHQSADRARWRLGQLRQHQQDWQNALAAYRAVSREFSQFADVVDRAGNCYVRWLQEEQASGRPTEAIARAAAEWFASLAAGSNGQLPRQFGPVQRNAAVTAARLWLEYAGGGNDVRAERLVSAALAGSPDAPAEWKAAARAVLVFSLAAQNNFADAATVLRQISTGRPEELFAVLEGLSRLGADGNPRVRAQLAELQLSLIELVRPRRDALDLRQQQSLDRMYARALADADRIEEALDAYGRLAETDRADAEAQQAYAQLLSGRQDRGSLETALANWREVAKRSTVASTRWFDAKYAIAHLHYRLGDPEKTAAIIRQLEILHPEMGGSAMKDRFVELRKRCEQ